MFFPGTPNIFVPGDSVFMLFKCMCNNISMEKKDFRLLSKTFNSLMPGGNKKVTHT